MKKFLIILVSLVAAGGLGGTGYFWYQNQQAAAERQVLVGQNGQLQAQLDAIGPIVDVYTVTASMKAGKEVKAEDLQKQTIPQASVSENHIKAPEDVIGKYFKIAVNPGVSLTTDIFMEDENLNTIYYREIGFKVLPIGLGIGDYIDVRLVLPYGEEYIVLEHLRVERRVDNVVTVRLTEEELALYTSVMTDLALYKNTGLRTYATQYVEPGLAEPSAPFYPVRKEMEAICVLNANIKDKKRVVNAAVRDDIEVRLKNVLLEHGGILNAGVGELFTQDDTAAKVWVDRYQGNDELAASGVGGTPGASTGNGSAVSPVPPEYAGDGNVETPNTDQTDGLGNSNNITQDDIFESSGGDLFDDEEVIQ